MNNSGQGIPVDEALRHGVVEDGAEDHELDVDGRVLGGPGGTAGLLEALENLRSEGHAVPGDRGFLPVEFVFLEDHRLDLVEAGDLGEVLVEEDPEVAEDRAVALLGGLAVVLAGPMKAVAEESSKPSIEGRRRSRGYSLGRSPTRRGASSTFIYCARYSDCLATGADLDPASASVEDVPMAGAGALLGAGHRYPPECASRPHPGRSSGK